MAHAHRSPAHHSPAHHSPVWQPHPAEAFHSSRTARDQGKYEEKEAQAPSKVKLLGRLSTWTSLTRAPLISVHLSPASWPCPWLLLSMSCAAVSLPWPHVHSLPAPAMTVLLLFTTQLHLSESFPNYEPALPLLPLTRVYSPMLPSSITISST